ncbi:MAG: hypothetical protein JRH13_01140 [Deltaproteobacteria bacterium]|nr:hypothetical protein [Deltaproteobacteria bacterium]MBW2015934.1 hypothetical protein [Deltaproteobacteria bacterium]MBW2127952.1 hypothetical protein [Deltaproteobacteria bacterium]MBW2303216.1 hypothetical protein [Deltaproteobacteria bacterium]
MMETRKRIWRRGFKINSFSIPTGLVFLFLIVLTSLEGTSLFAGEKTEGSAAAKRWDLFNLRGRVIGSVDNSGSVYNRVGVLVGTVDKDGTVYNVRRDPVARVDADGSVRSRTGNLVGFVDRDGNVYNRLRKKVGSGKGIHDTVLLGGAAQLLIFMNN